MPDYEKMYGILFNAITDALEHLGRRAWKPAVEVLEEAQGRTEDLYAGGEQKMAAAPTQGS